MFSAVAFLVLGGVLLTLVVFFLPVFLLVLGLALVLGSPSPAVFCCSRWRTTVGAASLSGAAGVLAGGAVAVVVVVVVGVVASVVDVELVDDESPLLASGLGSAEVDVVVVVVAESAALAVVFTASGPAMPAARAESTARRIRLRAVITPAMPPLRSSRASLLRRWAERRRPGLRR